MHHDPVRAVLVATRRALRTTDAPLLLAVSGGLDSMVLLHAVTAVARGRIATVATFDHGTGASATKAIRAVTRCATALGLPVVTGRIGGTGGLSSGREAAWRAARHQFLGEAASILGARVVTAHTEDDQLETVVMRIMRGAGARGIAGLYAEGKILRPFLPLRRAALEEYAAAAFVSWQDDPSNVSRVFARNRVRHDLLPAMRAVAPKLDDELLTVARQAAQLRRDVDAFVDDVISARIDGHRLVVGARDLDGYDRASLAVLWATLAGRVGLALDRRGTERISMFTNGAPRYGFIPLSGGWTLEATPSAYILQKEVNRPVTRAVTLPVDGTLDWGAFRFRVSAGTMPSSEWTASIAGPAPGVVRAWRAGDRLEAAAGQPRRRVTRYLSDVGVAGADRRGWPVVVTGEQVVWIPGVRRSDAATDRSGRPVRHYVCERIDR